MANSNCFRLSIRKEILWHVLQGMRCLVYDIIVFENLRFRPSTRKRWTGVFKNPHTGERLETCVFGDRLHFFTGYVRIVGQTAEKIKRIRADGALSFCFMTLRRRERKRHTKIVFALLQTFSLSFHLLHFVREMLAFFVDSNSDCRLYLGI